MAVVTLKYTKNRAGIKAHLRYITHRRGREQSTITRALFDETGATDKAALYEAITKAGRGTVFYKFMISPDPRAEDQGKDLDLAHITRRTIKSLEKALHRRLPFVAVIHDDHTDKRHVHGFFLLKGRLSREEFRLLCHAARGQATRQAHLQRRTRDLVRTHARALVRIRSLPRALEAPRGGGTFTPLQPGCSSCGYGEFSGIPAFRTFCPMCRARLGQIHQSKLALGRGGA